MMIKSINTFITASTMFAELADLHKNITASGDLEMMFPFWGLVCRRPGNIATTRRMGRGLLQSYSSRQTEPCLQVNQRIHPHSITFVGSTSVKIYNPTVPQRKKKQTNELK